MGCGASSAEQAEVAGEKKNAELVRQMGASGDKDEVDRVDLFDARDAWRLADVNDDGVLDKRELSSALEEHPKIQKLLMGQSNAAKILAQLFKTIDRDDSGSIEKHEFLAYLDAKDKRDELRQAVLHANCGMLQELVEVDECNLHWDLGGEIALTLAVNAKMRPPAGRGKLSRTERDEQHHKLIHTLLDLKADPHAANKAGSTALITAAQYDRAAVITALLTWEVPEIQQLVTSPVQPAVPAPNGWYALGMAVEHSSTQAIKALLELSEMGGGADPNQPLTISGGLPLVRAVQLNHLPSIKLLAKYGADPRKEDENGQWALQIAKSDKVKHACQNISEEEFQQEDEAEVAKQRAAEIRAEKDHIDQMQAGMDPSLLIYSKIKAKVRNDDTQCEAADKDHDGQLDAHEARKGYLSECNRVSYQAARAAVNWWKRNDELKFIATEDETGLLLKDAKDEQVFKEYIMQCKRLWDEMGEESAVHDKMLYDVHEEAGTNLQVVKDLTTEFRDDFGSPVQAGQVAALEAENHNFAATVMVPSKTGTDSRPATGIGFDRRKLNEENLAARIGGLQSETFTSDRGKAYTSDYLKNAGNIKYDGIHP